MITVKDFMETCDYRITEGSDYCWQCFGPNAYRLDSWNGEQDGHSISIVFDTQTHVVYEVSAYDYRRERAYRRINPDFKAAHDAEADDRGVLGNQAWDGVDYVDLDVDEDFLVKAQAIFRGDTDYDTRVQIPLELPDDVLFDLMKMAHDRDITLNKMVEIVLQEAIDQADTLKEWFSEDVGMRDEYDFSESEQGPVEESLKKLKKKKKKGQM